MNEATPVYTYETEVALQAIRYLGDIAEEFRDVPDCNCNECEFTRTVLASEFIQQARFVASMSKGEA